MPMPEISVASSIEDAAAFDAIVVVTPDVAALEQELSASASASAPVAAAIGAALSRHRAVDKTLGDDGTATLLVVEAAPGGRVVVAGVGSRSGEGADVRLWGDAAASGVVRARGAGASRPLLLLHGAPDAEASCSSGSSLPPALAVALLGVLQALYEPLQAREHEGDDGRVKLEPVQQVGFVPPPSCACSHEQTALFVRRVRAIESGRRLARDVGNSDPERMTPQQCAAYIQQSLEGLPVSVQVVSDVAEIEREYPLAYAVARGSLPVERHHPRIVRLEYVPAEGTVDETLLFSAKGIVYDTGGADIKTGGIMAGMHLDKAGACNVAGFLKTVGLLRPAGLRVVAELGFVRNSCGSDSYVSDEIVRYERRHPACCLTDPTLPTDNLLTWCALSLSLSLSLSLFTNTSSHAGKRVQVLNTDAEGRMVLSDMLSHLRERVLQDRDAYPNPRFFTCATLTGHASRYARSCL